jgi:hypothetical protein
MARVTPEAVRDAVAALLAGEAPRVPDGLAWFADTGIHTAFKTSAKDCRPTTAHGGM